MFEIVVDSAANIPAEDVKKYQIKVISFINYVNGQQLTCFDPDLTLEEERSKGKKYYDAMRSDAQIKTSLVSPQEFENYFRKICEEGKDILYISLSKNISGTYNAARIAAETVLDDFEGRRIRLVDSMNASLGQGILAIYASEYRAQGMSVDETADQIESYVLHMNGVFTVEDLKYLSRTGRIHGAVASVGNMLNIKPILRGSEDGYIVQFKKCRGRKASIKALIDLLCDNITDPENQILGIAHADAYEESLHIMEEVNKRVTVRGWINTSYDYCTGSHVGPGTLAIFFMAKDRSLGV